MDLHYAETLISPLKVGKPIARDWELKRIEVDKDEGSIIYCLGRQDLMVKVQPRDDSAACYQQTEHLNVSLITDGSIVLSKTQESLLKFFVGVLAKNDHTTFLPSPDWKKRASSLGRETYIKTGRSILYLVPGHIGEPRDITLRALDILNEVKTIFVEDVDSLLANFKIWNIDPSPKRILLASKKKQALQRMEEELHRLVTLGENSCFFGCEEGIPGFEDPGQELVRLAEELSDEIEIRTVSAGSALSTSIMRVLPTYDGDAFNYLGMMESDQDSVHLLQNIQAASASPRGAICFFAMAKSLKKYWTKLFQASQHLHGELVVTANLTLRNEFCVRLPIDKMSAFDSSTLDDEDKLVVWLLP